MQFRIFFNMRLINLFIRKFQSFFSIKKQHIPQKWKFHINSEKYLTSTSQNTCNTRTWRITFAMSGKGVLKLPRKVLNPDRTNWTFLTLVLWNQSTELKFSAMWATSESRKPERQGPSVCSHEQSGQKQGRRKLCGSHLASRGSLGGPVQYRRLFQDHQRMLGQGRGQNQEQQVHQQRECGEVHRGCGCKQARSGGGKRLREIMDFWTETLNYLLFLQIGRGHLNIPSRL